jgi:hypothetical protein
MDKSEKRGFVLGVLSSVVGNAVWWLLAGGAVVGFVASWFKGLTTLEQALLWNLSAVLLLSSGGVAVFRYRQSRRGISISDAAPLKPKVEPRWSAVGKIEENAAAYVIVQNLGEAITVYAYISATAGIPGWPTESPLFAQWEGSKLTHASIQHGETRRLIVAQFVGDEQRRQWVVPFARAKDGPYEEAATPVSMRHQFPESEVTVTLLTEPPSSKLRTHLFRFTGEYGECV